MHAAMPHNCYAQQWLVWTAKSNRTAERTTAGRIQAARSLSLPTTPPITHNDMQRKHIATNCPLKV